MGFQRKEPLQRFHSRAPQTALSHVLTRDVSSFLQDDQLSCANVLVTCAIEEFSLADEVRFLVSVLTTLIAIPVKVSLCHWLFAFTFGIVIVFATF